MNRGQFKRRLRRDKWAPAKFTGFEPEILAFCVVSIEPYRCSGPWQRSMRLNYPTSVKIIKFPGTGEWTYF